MKGWVIAIDGPSASGKGTAARLLAQKLGYAYIDTGLLYRAVGVLAERRGLSTSDAEALGALARQLTFRFDHQDGGLRLWVDGEDLTDHLRTAAAGAASSRVSALPQVRAALLDQQRALAQAGGVVMDGRDIGTVVLPQADLKVFLEADPQERARRRHEELRAKGDTLTLAQVASELVERDERDAQRAVAPMRPADGALRVDSTHLSPEGVVERILARLAAASRDND
jgi:cytidylate kinase